MAIYHVNSFHWQIFFQVAKIFMNLTNLSFFSYFNLILILMKLSLFPSENVSMHQRENPVNTI